jgi:hypothetical protein
MNRLLARRALTLTIITALLASFLILPMPVAAQAPSISYEKGTIVFDYSHGQYSGSVAFLDGWLDDNLTALGYDVVWAYGGINDTILEGAVALIVGAIYGADNGFTAAEVTAIGDWFNAGNKFLWVGADSDYAGYTYINDNSSLILEAVGSHVYPEPTAVEDPFSNCASGYRAVANTTSDDLAVRGIVAGVDAVLMHGPTLLYGSNSTTPAKDVAPVALETVEIANVYPLLYYGASATIVDADLTAPVAHTDGAQGSFVAAALEVDAGTDGSGVIVTSGASPYGDYRPMFTDSYYSVDLNGFILVLNAIHMGIIKATGYDRTGTIIFDYSHGQYSGSVVNYDYRLGNILEFMGYTVTWIYGGINSTILENAVGLIVGAIYGNENGFTAAEVTAVSDWFNAGHKFMWVGGDSDYSGYSYINNNATLLLEAAGSHVYMEPTSVEDPSHNCGSGYRPYTMGVGADPMVVNITENVDNILMHGPTLLYGSNSTTPGANVSTIALEAGTPENVYVLLTYGSTATIVDADLTAPVAHTDGATGAFVAATFETMAGAASNGVIIVSGASPYGDYRPMFVEQYYGIQLDGYNFVPQAIDYGIQHAVATTGMDMTLVLAIAGIGAVVVIIIIVVVMKRK